MVHFANLKKDRREEMRRIASYLDIAIDESMWDAMVEHCTFEYMKEHADLSAPLGREWSGKGAERRLSTRGRMVGGRIR